MYLATIGV